MKKFVSMLLAFSMAFCLCACSSKDDKNEETTVNAADINEAENNAFAEYLLSTIGVDGIEMEIGEEENGSVFITAHIPDYTQLFLAVAKASDPTAALKKAIEKKDYATIEYTGYAEVTYDEQGDQVIHSEELIKSFIEIELIKAVNAASEEEA